MGYISTERPYIWQMVKESIENLGGNASYSDIKSYIWKKYGDINERTINAQIIVCIVNHPSRIHYPENKKPRISKSKYDFLFRLERGKVEFYDTSKHGIWEIKENEYGKLIIAQTGLEDPDLTEEDRDDEMRFALEAHLRDFIAKNIETIQVNGKRLKLFKDETGRDGVEYPTDVGRIDILAFDEDGIFVVFELKVSRGADSALGQILRYMGWIKNRFSPGSKVKGIIVAKQINEKLKFAASIIPNINLFEYTLDFKLSEVSMDI